MTLAIQRQPRFNTVLLVGGMVVVAAGLVFAINRAAEPTDAGNSAAVQTHYSIGTGHRFESVQDAYLVPPAILARQAVIDAELRLQDGYLPPASTFESSEAWLMVQDGYLPPADRATAVETPEQSATPDGFGPR